MNVANESSAPLPRFIAQLAVQLNNYAWRLICCWCWRLICVYAVTLSYCSIFCHTVVYSISVT